MPEDKKCEVVEIITPGRVVLDGLWYGEKEAETVLVFVHGLSSTVFAHHNFLLPMADKKTGLLFFNNRGHDNITGIKKLDKRKNKGYSRFLGGQAHEVFTDCVDDLDGAVKFAGSRGAKRIFLIGHSTGSQKTVFYLSQRGNQQKITGAILLSPMSDYAAMVKEDVDGKLPEAQRAAKKLVDEGKGRELMLPSVWPEVIDAQRFLSLYTPGSEEEIFCYAQSEKKPEMLRKIRIPVLVVLAEKDEYRDRPMKQIGKWFGKYLRKKGQAVKVVEGAVHGFDGKEDLLAQEMEKWIYGGNF